MLLLSFAFNLPASLVQDKRIVLAIVIDFEFELRIHHFKKEFGW